MARKGYAAGRLRVVNTKTINQEINEMMLIEISAGIDLNQ